MPISLPAQHMAVAFHHAGGNVTGEMVNTCAFDLSTATGGGPQDSLDDISLSWGQTVQALHSTPIAYVKATAKYALTGATFVDYESLSGAIGGSGATPPMPLNVTAIIEKRTGLAGRKFRGRFLFGGFPQATTGLGNVNELDPTVVTSYQTAFDNFYDAVIALGCVPVLLHPVGGPPPTQILSFLVKPLVGNLRKRIR